MALVDRVRRFLGMKPKRRLTKKQSNQRRYASAMRGIRKRARQRRGGRGRIADRPAASKLRKQLGLKAGRRG